MTSRSDRIECLLGELSSCTDALSYLRVQDAAIEATRAFPAALSHLALRHPNPHIRFEALHVLSAIAGPDDISVLLRSRDTDPDSSIQECASALLLRAATEARVRSSGRLSDAAFEDYRRNVREMTAASLFPAPT